MPPKIEDLIEVSGRLTRSKVHHALGGSGLLGLLGISVAIDDWDITTDAPAQAVESALPGYNLRTTGPKGHYRSEFLCRVIMPSSIIEIIGSFSIMTGSGIVAINTDIHSYYKGVPLGSPREWLKAYRAMGVPDKACLLEEYLDG